MWQVISLKKMVVLSAKFAILIYYLMVSYLYSFNPFIGINETSKYLAPTIYNSTENRHPWQTPCVRVKGSDRRPFISILDWIMVYASSTMWMNLSPYPNLWKAETMWMNFFPYPNLWKAEKLKSQSTLKILGKIFI